MTAVDLIASNSDPSDADIDVAMRNNVYRCGTYPESEGDQAGSCCDAQTSASKWSGSGAIHVPDNVR